MNAKRVARMLLSYQSGNVRVGEVVRSVYLGSLHLTATKNTSSTNAIY